jgi:molecular chaperone HscB
VSVGFGIMDPFATLGLARSFDVDLTAVERTHRELSRALHPDKYVSATASERRAALSKAVEVNEAWRVVRDPIRRAEALLKLGGVAVGEDKEPAAAPEFLMDMLEQREELGEAKQARDIARVRVMARVIAGRAEEAERDLAEGFARGDAASLVGKLGELRFYRRFLDEVSAIEDELAA